MRDDGTMPMRLRGGISGRISPCEDARHHRRFDKFRPVDAVSQDRAGGAGLIFALGECAEHRGICYGLVEPATSRHACWRGISREYAAYSGSVVATNLRSPAVSVFSAGDSWRGWKRSHRLNDVRHGTYKKLVISMDV